MRIEWGGEIRITGDVAGCAGTVNTKGGTAQVGTPLAVGASLGDCEGIYLRALGDGQQYVVQLMQGAPLPDQLLA